MSSAITIRKATTGDLCAINKVISAAIMTWNIPERVKRLSLPNYHYSEHDLETLQLLVAEYSAHLFAGIAAWEPADPKDIPRDQRSLLLHGIYVHPEYQGRGIGRQLLLAAERTAASQGYNGILVKAQASAAGFFLAMGMQPLPVVNEKRDYAHRYWKTVSG